MDPGHPVYNAIPGRYVNRIGNGKYKINRKTYITEQNDGNNTLHSGTNNWSYRTWNVTAATKESITFSIRDEAYSSKGMPGLVLASVTYSVAGNKWNIKMNAVSPTTKTRSYTRLSAPMAKSSFCYWQNSAALMLTQYAHIQVSKTANTPDKSPRLTY